MTRLSVDIGGTFTDLALLVGDSLQVHKLLTTPSAPEVGALQGIRELLARCDLSLDQVESITHGTTLATNALIERKGARLALVTTAGFRDVLEMRNEKRFDQYDLDIELPEPLVPRQLRYTLSERVLADGSVVTVPEETEIRHLAENLIAADVEAVSIGFLHSYRNPLHEEYVRDCLASQLDPSVTICLSSDVSPEAREYERFSTVCANSYIRPLMTRYLQAFNAALSADGFSGPLMLMLSGGGVTTLEQSMRYPIRLLESGPAGGVALAAKVAAEVGSEKTLALDMGGTTAKICLLEKAKARTTRRLEVARAWRNIKGSGLPVRIPSIELVEIGAGGGSIAHVDALERLSVGPESAAADPGPAAYALGGTNATVTDANLVLGRIDAEDFAGGQLSLDTNAAKNAISHHVTSPLKFNSNAWAATGIVEISEETMANAARVHSIELGQDLAEYDLVASGGGAPLHAVRIAEKLSIKRVIIPRYAGVGSAIGFLHAPIAYEQAQSVLASLPSLDTAKFSALIDKLTEQVMAVIRSAVPQAQLAVTRLAELRYVGQGQELRLPLDAALSAAEQLPLLDQRFRDRYQQAHGFTMQAIEVELVAVSVTANVIEDRKDTQNKQTQEEAPAARPAGNQSPARQKKRTVFDSQLNQSIQIEAYARDDINPQATLTGPCIITEAQTSTLVPAGWDLTTHQSGHLILDRAS